MAELTIIKIFADGRTEPFIEFGTPLILIQDGVACVGRLCHEDGDTSNVYIEHPENEDDLNIPATNIIAKQNPEYFKSDTAILVVCPRELVLSMVWKK